MKTPKPSKPVVGKIYKTLPVKPGTGVKKPLPVKPGKPGRPGDKLNPLPTVGGNSKAIKDKKLKDLQLQIDKAKKAKSPSPRMKPKKGM